MLMQRNAPPPLVADFNATDAQLALPWTRDPSFRGISPHGLNVSRNPVKFFFQYCGPKGMKPGSFQQTLPMSAGSACDGLLKAALAKNEWHKNRRRYFRGKVNKRTFSVYGTVAHHNRLKKVRLRAYQTMRGQGPCDVGPRCAAEREARLPVCHRRRAKEHRLRPQGQRRVHREGQHAVPRLQHALGLRHPHGQDHRVPGPQQGGATARRVELGLRTRTILAQATFKPPSKQPKVRKDGTSREWENQDGKITITGIDSYVSAEFQLEVLNRYRQLWANIQAKTLVPDKIAGWGVDVMFPLATKDHLDDLVL
jgi:hypothetical protein